MRGLQFLALVGCGLSTASPAAAAPLQPTAKWGVDFGDAHCIAYRHFDTPGRSLMLTVKAPVLGDDLQISLITPGKGDSIYGKQFRGTWQIEDAVPAPLTWLDFTSQAATPPNHIVMMNLPRVALAPLSTKAGVFTLATEKEVVQQLSIQGFGAVLPVLDQCVADLRIDWGVTPDVVVRYAQRIVAPSRKFEPLAPPDGGRFAKSITSTGIFSSEDYPSQPLDEGDDGDVRAVLLIDETGRVADCTLTKASGVAALDSQTCAVYRERARYKPARDKAGKARRDVDTATIHWVIR